MKVDVIALIKKIVKFYLRAKWQFTDWAVQARMLYGPKPS